MENNLSEIKPIVSYTSLNYINQSINAFLNYKFNKPDKASFKKGRAFHCFFLTPDKFKDDFIVIPEGLNLTKKDGIAWKNEHIVKYELGLAIKFEQLECFKQMEKALLNHPLSWIFETGNVSINQENPSYKVEHYMKTQYNDNIELHGYTDILNMDIDTIIDVKAISDIKKADRDVKWLYPSQPVIYKKLVRDVYNIEADFIFAFVEDKPPFDVRFIKPSNDTLQYGFDFVERNIAKFEKFLLNRNGFIGYSKEFEVV